MPEQGLMQYWRQGRSLTAGRDIGAPEIGYDRKARYPRHSGGISNLICYPVRGIVRQMANGLPMNGYQVDTNIKPGSPVNKSSCVFTKNLPKFGIQPQPLDPIVEIRFPRRK